MIRQNHKIRGNIPVHFKKVDRWVISWIAIGLP